MKNGMEKLRQWSSASSLRLFSAPYLPSGLIWTALLAAYTDLMVLLLGQPAGYWIDRGRAASSFPLLQSLLAAGILPYLLAGLLYLALLWLALTVLTRSFALAAWLPLSFVHLVHALSWAFGKAGLADASMPGTILAGSLDAAAGLLLGAVLAIFLLKPTRPAAPARRI